MSRQTRCWNRVGGPLAPDHRHQQSWAAAAQVRARPFVRDRVRAWVHRFSLYLFSRIRCTSIYSPRICQPARCASESSNDECKRWRWRLTVGQWAVQRRMRTLALAAHRRPVSAGFAQSLLHPTSAFASLLTGAIARHYYCEAFFLHDQAARPVSDEAAGAGGAPDPCSRRKCSAPASCCAPFRISRN